MNEVEKEKLKKLLLQYPDLTEENIAEQIYMYEQREGEKQGLMKARGFSNAMAESYLDRAGYPRPPGWHSVFFYPGSNRPRNMVIFLMIIISGMVWFFVS